MNIPTYFAGVGMGLSLLVAIGAQNAFVLRQGLRNQYVFAVCFACALSDAILIVVGVTIFRQISAALTWLDPVIRYGGAAFLIWYGAKSPYSAFKSSGTLEVEEDGGAGFGQVIMMCLALTWLNPHVYLDTVVLLGTVASHFPGSEAAFGAGAVTGSFLFFFALGYSAVWLRPLFANPLAWRVLETIIALIMWIIAYKLLTGV